VPNPRDDAGTTLADEYFGWLENSPVGWTIRVERGADRISMVARGTQTPLLILALDASPSDERRAIYRVVGGTLAKGDGRAYFEFCPLPHVNEFIVALRNFRTVLPWLLYRWTQGLVHGWVMNRFGHHMKHIGAEDDASQ
jgi:hypothetical protein